MVEELQTYWEVPTIAHFCKIFHTAFKLIHFKIEHLEMALSGSNESVCYLKIEDLIIKLLQGCLQRKQQVNSSNWEELLYKFLNTKSEENSCMEYTQMPFDQLPVKGKVDILLKLCELRVQTDDALNAIKHIDCDELRIEPVGTDHENNVYWYFYGMRLYKENTKMRKGTKNQPSKKIEQKPKIEETSSCRKSSRHSSRKMSTNRGTENNKGSLAWSIVCHTLEDWQNLIQKFKESKNNHKLGLVLEETYLPEVSRISVKEDRLERQQLYEFLPRRTSSRIEKVREEQKNKMEAERQVALQRLEEIEKQKQWDAENKQRVEREERAKKFKETKSIAMYERAKRAKLRENRQFDDSSDDDDYEAVSRRILRSRSPVFRDRNYPRNSLKEDESNSSDNSEENSDNSEENSENLGNDNKGYKNSESENESCENSESDSDEDSESANNSDENYEDNKKSTSAQVSSSEEEENRDTNVKFGSSKWKNVQYSNSPRNFDIQNFITYSPNFPQKNKPVLTQQRNGPLIEHVIPKNIMAYSKMDQSKQVYGNNNSLAQSMKKNFMLKMPETTAKIVQPVSFRSKFYN